MMVIEEQIEKVELLKGQYAPYEAYEIISGLIQENIKQSKLQHWRNWEGDHSVSSEDLQGKLFSLNSKKELLKFLMGQAKNEGARIELEGEIKIKWVK